MAAAAEVGCRAPRSDGAVRPELRDLVRRVPELSEDLVGVLAEQRGRATNGPRRLRQADGYAGGAHTTCDRVVDFRDQSEMSYDRIVEDLTQIVDRSDRHVRLAQLAHDVRLGHLMHACRDERDE